ncbi:MAG: type I-F CRISPR-associated endoribonuclease Cas6/Csy4 [Thiothrix sp.]|nr:type I-F CRISPR-associated endoribonuclease Cas6/Csy4 [Thiothrix sp.]
MYYYNEITCLPDEGISTGFVMGRVMDVLHLCLVNLAAELGRNPVGISFPGYCDGETVKKPQIGGKIRLFSQDMTYLERLHLKEQLVRFSDYVHIRSGTVEHPARGFAVFRRVQPKSSRERLIRRQVKRSGQTEECVRANYQAFTEGQSDLPFVNMKSHSSERRFRLFVQKQVAGVVVDDEWQFSSYGLSSSTPVPDF